MATATGGYGDFGPENAGEYFVASFIIIFGSGIFAYAINNIHNILDEYFAKRKKFKYFFLLKIRFFSNYLYLLIIKK